MDNVVIKDFTAWKQAANIIGWVHAHDQYVVVDCIDSGKCVGEYTDGVGWLDKSYLEHYGALGKAQRDAQ